VELDTDLIEAMYDVAVEMAAREGDAAQFWRRYFPCWPSSDASCRSAC